MTVPLKVTQAVICIEILYMYMYVYVNTNIYIYICCCLYVFSSLLCFLGGHISLGTYNESPKPEKTDLHNAGAVNVSENFDQRTKNSQSLCLKLIFLICFS